MEHITSGVIVQSRINRTFAENTSLKLNRTLQVQECVLGRTLSWRTPQLHEIDVKKDSKALIALFTIFHQPIWKICVAILHQEKANAAGNVCELSSFQLH